MQGTLRTNPVKYVMVDIFGIQKLFQTIISVYGNTSDQPWIIHQLFSVFWMKCKDRKLARPRDVRGCAPTSKRQKYHLFQASFCTLNISTINETKFVPGLAPIKNLANLCNIVDGQTCSFFAQIPPIIEVNGSSHGSPSV